MASSALSLCLLFLFTWSVVQAQLTLFNIRATGLKVGTDGYVKVFCGPADLGKTSTRNNNRNPWWEEEFSYFRAQQNDVLRMELYDHDTFFDDWLGTCQRQIKVGTHEHDCFLEKGTLHYSYTLIGDNQE